MASNVSVNHHVDQLLERHRRLPRQQRLGPRRIAHELVHFCGAEKARIDDYVSLVVESDSLKRDPAEFAD